MILKVAFTATLLLELSLLASGAIHNSLSKFPRVEYDFVIVGGGNAGCVVANRLSENPKFNVLVIEAGPSYEGVLDAQVPGFLPALLQNSTYDYNYTSVAQSQLNDRRLGLPRARLLGGSSSHNGMLYTRGSSSDYDRWAAVTGDAGWSWKKLLPYIFRNEKWVKPNRDIDIEGMYDPRSHSYKGMTFVSLPSFPDPALRTQTEWFREWKTSRTGPLTFLNVNTVAWTRLPDDSPVYAQYPDPSSGRNTPQLEIQFVGTGLYPTPGPNILLAAVLVTPGFESRGSVKLNSTNIYDSPLIDLGLMKSGFDWYGLREAVRASRRFFAAPAWQDYQLTLLPPFDTDNDEQLDEGIRDLVTGALHPVGSASMSPKGAQWGVVDPDLRVKKVRGLRIVDASVMPYITSGHTQAPVYAIAERAADLIKQYWA